jgi:maltooligosyltrehalose trehalohydrolase
MYAPAPAYGRPDDLRRFVDQAHGLGLAVILDVVYNHFGPDGAYAVALSQRFLSDRHPSPWGSGVNLDGPDATLVRDFFIDNAQHWIHEYRVDGLRLDATHALVDEGPRQFLQELTSRVRASCPHRQVWVIAEDHRNLRTILDPPTRAGWGLDAVWADDLHHVLRRLSAGDDEGYYRDFRGTPDEVARTLNDGWLYRGEYAPHFGGPRGTDPTGLPRAAFVVCLQNHDQVGNRALGDRLHHTIDRATYRALSVLLLLAPETPLLFMGQEWAASSPFQFFTDHAGDLGARVREGRREEFRGFRAFADAAGGERIPDPQAEATFERSRLRWEETTRPQHSQVTKLYRDTLRLRRELASGGVVGGPMVAQVTEGMTGIIMRRVDRAGHEIFAVVCLVGAGHVSLDVNRARGDAHSKPPDLNDWRVLIDTENPRYTDDPRPLSFTCDVAKVTMAFSRAGGLVLMRH